MHADDRPTGTRFATDTAVEPLGPGCFRARLDRGWWIQRGPNGGYLAAILQRAICAAVDDPTRSPRSLTVHYLRPPAEGDVDVEATVERSGRTLSTVTARMSQGGKLVALAVGALATERDGGVELDDTQMPDVPPPEACQPMPGGGPDIPMRGRYETRPAVGGPLFAGEGPEALTGGWIRLADGEPLDPIVLVALTDAWPPAVFTKVVAPLAVPTVDLTVHLRQPITDPDGWCLAVFRTRLAAGGYLEEDGEVWSQDGRLLAQSRQLAVAAPV